MVMGIPLNKPCFNYGDSQSVLWNISVPDFMCKKKIASVFYHFECEFVSAYELRIAYINTKLNPADILTKELPQVELDVEKW